jgi:hypothetical protein
MPHLNLSEEKETSSMEMQSELRLQSKNGQHQFSVYLRFLKRHLLVHLRKW